jgi:hypothetical protein
LKKEFIPSVTAPSVGAENPQKRKVIRLSETIVLECDYLKEVLFSQKDNKLKYNEKNLRQLVDSLQRHASLIGESMRAEQHQQQQSVTVSQSWK